MKKVGLLIALVAFALGSFAQKDSTKSKGLDMYLGGSLSTSTGTNFNQDSYAGIELGVCAKNMMFGYATGRGNLDYTSDMTQNYWGELKAYACLPIGSVKAFILGGFGQYYNTTHSFIEYGVGAAYSIKKIDLSITVSNWDNKVYISPGVCWNFSLGK